MSIDQKLVVKSAPSTKGTLFRSSSPRALAWLGRARLYRRFIRLTAQKLFASGGGFVMASGNALLAPGEIELAAENVNRLFG